MDPIRFEPVLVAETATTEPIVGDGTFPSTPFWAVAVDESVAKPTDGGLDLKTEYTFFYIRKKHSASGSD